MTRDEAIEWLGRIKDRYIHGGDEGFDNKRKEAIDMAIESLQQEEHLVELEAKAVAIIKSERHGELEKMKGTEE